MPSQMHGAAAAVLPEQLVEWRGKPLMEWIDPTLRSMCSLLDCRLVALGGPAPFRRDADYTFKFAWTGSEKYIRHWTFWNLQGSPDDGTWDMQITRLIGSIGEMLDGYYREYGTGGA